MGRFPIVQFIQTMLIKQCSTCKEHFFPINSWRTSSISLKIKGNWISTTTCSMPIVKNFLVFCGKNALLTITHWFSSLWTERSSSSMPRKRKTVRNQILVNCSYRSYIWKISLLLWNAPIGKASRTAIREQIVSFMSWNTPWSPKNYPFFLAFCYIHQIFYDPFHWFCHAYCCFCHSLFTGDLLITISIVTVTSGLAILALFAILMQINFWIPIYLLAFIGFLAILFCILLFGLSKNGNYPPGVTTVNPNSETTGKTGIVLAWFRQSQNLHATKNTCLELSGNYLLHEWQQGIVAQTVQKLEA